MNRYEKLNEDRLLEHKTLKVGAYCRVSTDNEDQANSFESQQRYFREYITRHEDWELVEIFADEGTSGTSTKKRKAFNKMIALATNGGLDLIITKEISRFARNTLDSIYYTRELKKHGVGVFFLNDNINTSDPDSELRLTIMSSIAQEESRRTSERVKWGQKRQMESGVVFGRDMLGYDVKNGELHINEDGAKTVRLIFEKFVNEGKGCHTISRELRESGIPTSTHMKNWSNTVILRVLRNEKYCGDLVQKKTFTPDYLSHDKKYNHGEEEFVILKNHHEPIISREVFQKANEILDSRSLTQEGKAKHSARYPFSGKIKCGRCGASYVARYKTRKDNSVYKSWRCFKANQNGTKRIDENGDTIGCTAESIRNEDAMHIMGLVCESLNNDKEVILSNLVKGICAVLCGDNTFDEDGVSNKLSELETKRTKLIELYTDGEITKDEFISLRERYEAQIHKLHSSISTHENHKFLSQAQDSIMAEIEDTLSGILSGATESEEFYGCILEKMVVQDKNNIDVFLKLISYKWNFAVEKPRNIKGFDDGVISVPSLGTEELGHLEMVGTLVYQLTRNLTPDEIEKSGYDAYFTDHTAGIYPVSAGGTPWSADGIASTGDTIADLTEDLAAEQKARKTYDNILRLSDDPEVNDVIRFLREREIVHYQRFGEGLGIVRDRAKQKNIYALNPSFDKEIPKIK
jgi:DNA invertase Pin-like site-specific DNA recombinase